MKITILEKLGLDAATVEKFKQQWGPPKPDLATSKMERLEKQRLCQARRRAEIAGNDTSELPPRVRKLKNKDA